jgi:putative protease
MPLSEVRSLAVRTGVELEYFVHGDMCVAHGSQCLYSTYLFGMSSNRGRCLKPCRWAYTIPGTVDAEPYPLAVKDMNLYAHLSDLITSGVSSFKIEGRMRSREFIVGLVNTYAHALDRFLEDPLAQTRADIAETEPYKKRDYSTGYAFGIPGRVNINRRGEGTGEFYSTGKMFSTPTAEREIEADMSVDLEVPAGVKPGLTVRIDSYEQALLALEFNPRRLYLSGEPWAPRRPLSMKQMEELDRLGAVRGCDLYLSLPRMMNEGQTRLFEFFLEKKPPLKGLLVSHFGALESFGSQGYELVGDASLNITNPEAIRFFQRRGLTGWTVSLELPFDGLTALAEQAPDEAGPGEVFFHGRPSVMYLDHDVSGEGREHLELVTDESRLAVRKDCWDRYHLLPEKELSLLPRTGELISAGYGLFRVDLQGYDAEAAKERLRAVSEALQSPRRGADLLSRLTPQGGFTYGAHR